jgi:hypothetical protein
MNRRVKFCLCAIAGLALLLCGWLVPVYLRGVDARVLERAGYGTAGLKERGLELVRQKRLSPAQLLLQAGRLERLPDWEELAVAVNGLAKSGPSPQDRLPVTLKDPNVSTNPVTEVVIKLENRDRILDFLHGSSEQAVQALLQCQALTNTVLFPPSASSSGQAFDAALSLCGLLMNSGRLHPAMSNTVFQMASQAGLKSEPLEEVLMDLLSLGQRLDWSQLSLFVGRIREPATLSVLTGSARSAEGRMPLLFSAVLLSGQPRAVADYLSNFSQTGLSDLGTSLRFGAGGVSELLWRKQRLYEPTSAKSDSLSALSAPAVEVALRAPELALCLKWFCYLAGGFLIAMALHFALRPVSALERPLQVRGFHLAREFLFALGFLLVVLLLSEPFLAQKSQKFQFSFRLRLPTVSSAAPAGTAPAKSSLMNEPTQVMTLLLFFVLQGLIYTACLVKLAEIRRQRVPARIKLKLLENEEHLFDAGLYLGFVGTIISLILVSLKFFEFSLMAAYSSTSFGIVFVSIFKIFNLRPTRRKLLLEAEVTHAEPTSSPAQTRSALAT